MTAIKPIVATVLALLISACGSSNQPTKPPPPVVDSIPRLAAGPHLGYIVGFDALDTNKSILADSLLAQATAAGQDFARVQLDWQGLEPQPGVYDIAFLMDVLDYASARQQTIFMTLTTLDTGSLTIPADLMSSDALTPAAGLNMDGPEIRARLHAFLDWLVPELAKYDVWGVAIANESSSNFSSIDQDAATNFLIDGVEYVRSLDSELAVTVTFVGEFFEPDVERFANELMPELDFAMFNTYCISGQTLLVSAPSDWISVVDKQIAIAAGKEIVYQELGCPAGYTDLGQMPFPTPVIGATAQLQDEYFRFMIDQILNRNELRGAFVFQLFDWSPELAQLFTDGLLDPGDPTTIVTAERLIEWLMTVGMCHWSDNTCRLAWDTYLDGVVRMANAR